MLEKKETLEEKLKRIKAADIMSRYAITASEDATIENIAHLMMRFKISGIPVINRDKKVVGIITATDLFKLMGKMTTDIERGVSLNYSQLSADTLMTKEVMLITSETSLFEIIKIMTEKNIHTLPVVVIDKQEIVGVIGRRDVINACYVTSSSK